jgi:small-conductance mechanosensitive channel
MHNALRSLLLAAILSGPVSNLAFAQAQPTESKEAAYTRTINERADKIVAKIEGLDAKKAPQVRDAIANQYRELNELQEKQDAQLAALKAKPQGENTADEKKKIEAAVAASRDKLHKKYLSKLSRTLTPSQVDQVKDGMTYGVLPITMKAYQEMLPDLTEAQKMQIMAWLTEAREHAMDAGSSKEKHAWFGKYKGRINNYLSAQGVDMKQAGKDWAERRARAATPGN